jgi:hypothetical protein
MAQQRRGEHRLQATCVEERAWRERDRGLVVFHFIAWIDANQRVLPWVQTAPLGRPLVPDVYMSDTGSSMVATPGRSRTSPAVNTPSDTAHVGGSAQPLTIWVPIPNWPRIVSTVGTNSSSRTRTRGDESPSTKASSAEVSRQLSRTEIAPIRAIAR